MDTSGARKFNRAAILDAVFASGETSRVELSAATKLSTATVSRVVDDLITEGIFVESGRLIRSDRGRPTRLIGLSRSVGCVVGVDLGQSKTHIVFSDLAAGVLGQTSLATPQPADARDLAAWLSELIHRAHREAGLVAPIQAFAVGVPGSVQMGGIVGRVVDKFQVIAGSAFRDHLQGLLGCSGVLEGDANLALLGEHAVGAARGRGDTVLLLAATSFSAGAAIGGRLLRGRNSLAGEYGSLSPPFSSHRLRDFISVTGLISTGRARGLAIDSVDELMSDAPDAGLERLQQEFAETIAFVVSIAAVSYDPELIVLAGRLAPLALRLLPKIKAALSPSSKQFPEITVTSLGEFAGAHGASLLALQSARHALRRTTAMPDSIIQEAWLFSPSGRP